MRLILVNTRKLLYFSGIPIILDSIALETLTGQANLGHITIGTDRIGRVLLSRSEGVSNHVGVLLIEYLIYLSVIPVYSSGDYIE